jgi:oligoribonuclease (3'-5' exoribonuclease)
MVEITVTVGKTTHVFTSEKQFMSQEDWIRAKKGQEALDAWVLRSNTEESKTHPDTIDFYTEWLQDQGITHTQTQEE